MKLRISLAQINPKTGDISGNAAKIIQGIEQAGAGQADIVVFPELCLTGYCLDEKLLLNLQFLRANREAVYKQIAPACRELRRSWGSLTWMKNDAGLTTASSAVTLPR